MNIFILDTDPVIAAHYYCDKHVPKLVVEQFQMMGSALRRYNVLDEYMPVTSKGTPLIGGYKHHPVTKWVGETNSNFRWAAEHAIALCKEYTYRYKKIHFCEHGIWQMSKMSNFIKEGPMTRFIEAMDNKYKKESPVCSYRNYYIQDKWKNIEMKWAKGRKAPEWFIEGVKLFFGQKEILQIGV